MADKIYTLKSQQEINKLDFVSCKQILNANGNEYTDEQIQNICDYLYQIAEIQCRHFKYWQQENENVVPININHHETKESIPLYPCEYRRTG